MNNDYILLAQRKSLLEYMQRLLADRLVDGDMPAKERVICEEVPYRDREVQQLVIQELSEELQQRSHELQLEMNQFVTTRKVPNGKLTQPKPTPAPKEGAKKRGRKPGAVHQTGGASDSAAESNDGVQS